MSLRASSGRFKTCSGDMKQGVPDTASSRVSRASRASPTTNARPKSTTLTA